MIATATRSNPNASRRRYFPTSGVPSEATLSPQAKQLLELIRRDKRVTRLTALHYSIPNPTARIAELRAAGFDVQCQMKTDADGRSYGSWFLAPKRLARVGDTVVMTEGAEGKYYITRPGTRGVVTAVHGTGEQAGVTIRMLPGHGVPPTFVDQCFSVDRRCTRVIAEA